MNKLYVDDFNRISNYSNSYAELTSIFANPRGHWLCSNKKNVKSTVTRILKRAGDSTLLLVIYFIPKRDLHGHSFGGARSDEEYLAFINDIAFAIGDKAPIIILEPDALPHALCSSSHELLPPRKALLTNALKILKNTNATVYLDAGHPRWIDCNVLSEVINSFDTSLFRGLSFNVSNFVPLDECIVYGQRIKQLTNLPFVIDTSRNGTPIHNGEWCNPVGASLGFKPTLDTGLRNVDAFLWIKIPGESDGKHNGGPKAGTFWPNYAQRLCDLQ